MNDTYYSVIPSQIGVGQVFKIQNEFNSYDVYKLVEPIVVKGNMITMHCIEFYTNLPKIIMYNKQYPRDLYVDKMKSDWIEK